MLCDPPGTSGQQVGGGDRNLQNKSHPQKRPSEGIWVMKCSENRGERRMKEVRGMKQPPCLVPLRGRCAQGMRRGDYGAQVRKGVFCTSAHRPRCHGAQELRGEGACSKR